jgi:hypothetical protein
MNKTINSLRLFLFTCSGEDNYILKRCKSTIQRRFALIGFFVLLIFVGCFFSATLFSYSLFQGAVWISIPIGVFWGAMVVNMYLLLLHTISPAIIPLASKKKRKTNKTLSNKPEEKASFLSLSMIFRMVFMMLLAIIIAQPLNIYLLSSTIATNIEEHKIQERVKLYSLTNKHLIDSEVANLNEFNKRIATNIKKYGVQKISNDLNDIKIKIYIDNTFLIESSKKLKQLNRIDNYVFLNKKENQDKKIIINKLEILLDNQISSDETFVQTFATKANSGTLKTDFEKYKFNLVSLVTEKIDNYRKLNTLLDKSNFYIKTIQLLLVENPISWVITIIVCIVFLYPIRLKYNARDISANKFLENNRDNPEIIKLRSELINTTNFNWLEKKIKSINVRDIRTSDYYFQRMLIEHKIILEEYDNTKKKFSINISENIKQYNANSLARLYPLLEKLKNINFSKYQELKNNINNEYKKEIVIKYEYWLDSPFRTKRIREVAITNNEIGLLDFVYNQSKEDDNL